MAPSRAAIIIPILLVGIVVVLFFSSPQNSSEQPQKQQQQHPSVGETPASVAHEEQPPPPPPAANEEKKKSNVVVVAPASPPPAGSNNKQSPSASSSPSSCPGNRFVERYFATDPVALNFAARAWEYKLSSSSSAPSLHKPLDGAGGVHARQRRAFQSASDDISTVSVPGHTGSKIPDAFAELLRAYTTVDEKADKFYGGQKAVDALEAACGWDKSLAGFSKKADCVAQLGFPIQEQQSVPITKSTVKSLSASTATLTSEILRGVNIEEDASLATVAHQLMDIVIPTIRDLDFLEDWREFIEPFHLILVQDGDPTNQVKIPPWADYELYNRHDIEATLGSNSWIISQKDASIRNFGFLVSKKPYVYTVDDDCFPASATETHNSATGGPLFGPPESVGGCSTKNPRDLVAPANPLLQHLRNLVKPSTPFFFNTIYDGYRPGSDFVRGFPYSMRDGVPTVLSHGLWLNVPDYDAPTQLVKPRERNTNHVDAAITVPAGVLYPMCSMNVAFDRRLIGPAFMQGLMGVGQPWARYDDMFAGWASKVVADHLALGVKSGTPYIFHKKASNPFVNLKKEYKGLWWQEVVIAFMNRASLPRNCTTPESSYRALALQLRAELTPLHPYFDRLATAMLAWVDAFEGAESGSLKFVPSRKSIPHEAALHRQLNQPNVVEMAPNQKVSTGMLDADIQEPTTTKPSSRADDIDSQQQQQFSFKKPAGCITYKERYAECVMIRRRPVAVQREYFRRVAGMGRDTTQVGEAALLRIHKRKWDEEFWLSVCAFVVEAAGASSHVSGSVEKQQQQTQRDVVLYTMEGDEPSVPDEFQPLVRTHMESYLRRHYPFNIFPSGKLRADLSAALFFKMHPGYNFVWVVEADARFVSTTGWGDLFSKSRRAARETSSNSGVLPYVGVPLGSPQRLLKRKPAPPKQAVPPQLALLATVIGRNSPIPSTSKRSGGNNNNNSAAVSAVSAPVWPLDFGLHADDAHFIWFGAPLPAHGYFDSSCNAQDKEAFANSIKKEDSSSSSPIRCAEQYQYSRRNYFSGAWLRMLEKQSWVGAFSPMFGLSRSLAEAIEAEAAVGNGHVAQEVTMPVTAQMYQLKIFPVQEGINTQIYFAWGDERGESSPMYLAWAANKAMLKDEMKKHRMGRDFDGLNCLADFLAHPVKF